MILALVGASCSSSSNGKGADSSLCDDYRTLVDAIRQPSFKTSRPVANADLTAARKKVDDGWRAISVGTSEPPIAGLAAAVAPLSAEFTTALISQWGANGSPLAAAADAADANIEPYAARNGLKLDADTTVGYTEFANLVNRLHGLLTQRCVAAPSGWRQPTDNAKDVPSGNVLVVEQKDEVFSLHEVDTDGVRDRGPIKAGALENVTAPVLSHDGKFVLVTSYDDSARAHYIGSSDGTAFNVVFKDLEPFTCATWSADDRSLLITRKTGTAAWVLTRVDLASSKRTDLSTPLPVRAAPCASADTGTQILGSAPTPSGDIGLWTMNPDGSGRKDFAALDGCQVISPTVNADRSTVLSVAACPDRYRSGLYTANIDGTKFEQALGGRVASPTWSPNGDWVAFAFVPLAGDGEQPSVWIASRDMTRFRQVAKTWASLPAWR